MPCIACVHITATRCSYTYSVPSRVQVATQTKPDLIIFVMDGSIGQAAHDQAKAFRDTVEVCAVPLTPHFVIPDDSTRCIWTGLETCDLQIISVLNPGVCQPSCAEQSGLSTGLLWR